MSIIRGPGWRAEAGLAAAPSSTAMVPGAVGGLARKPGLSRGPVPAAAAVIAAWLPGAPGRGSAGTRGGQGAPACAGRQPLTQHNDPSPQRRVGTGASAAPALGPLRRPLPWSGPRPEERRLPPGPQGTQALMVGRPDLRPETGTEGASDFADGETGSGKVQTEPLTVQTGKLKLRESAFPRSWADHCQNPNRLQAGFPLWWRRNHLVTSGPQWV